jgi:hypothetical protein
LRNAEKAKTRALRELESVAAREISETPMVPAELAAPHVKTIYPTKPSRVQTMAVPKRAPSVDASLFRRDPRTGDLLGPDGNPLSREAEDRLRYPDWPHISPHLKKEERPNTGPETEAKTGSETGSITGAITGDTEPVMRTQDIDSPQDSESEKISRKDPAVETDPRTVH